MLLYNAGLEATMVFSVPTTNEGKTKVVNWQNYGSQVSLQFYDQQWGKLIAWHGVLKCY